MMILLLLLHKKKQLCASDWTGVVVGLSFAIWRPFDDVMSSFWSGMTFFLAFRLALSRKDAHCENSSRSSYRTRFPVALLFFFLIVDFLFAAGALQELLDVNVYEASTDARFLAPGWPHLLGTDGLSRDLFLRLLYGGRYSLSVALVAGGASTLLGVFLGGVAASAGGKVDNAFLRLCEVAVSMPALPLLLLLAAVPAASFAAITPTPEALIFAVVVAGSATVAGYRSHRHRLAFATLVFVTLAFAALAFFLVGCAFWAFSRGQGPSSAAFRIIVLLCAFSWVRAGRLARGEILRLKASELFSSSVALGAPGYTRWRTLFLPHLQWVLLSVGALECASVFLAEAALSYLGFGLQPPWSSWGRMLLGALERVHHHPLQAFLPALCIVTCAFLMQSIGEGMRKGMDPNDV